LHAANHVATHKYLLERYHDANAEGHDPSDLQCVDLATLDFLEYLFIHSGIRYLLVIGAYRENEVSQGHPLTRAFDTIRAGDVRVQEIVLASGADDT
jgi:hypothetical protein